MPTPEAEAARQLTREIATVRSDRTEVRNRIQGLLATQGIRCDADATVSPSASATLQTGDGRPLAPAWRDRLTREWAHLQAIETRLHDVADGARRGDRRGRGPRWPQVAQQLCRLRGVARDERGHVQRGVVRHADASRNRPAARRADRVGAGAVSQRSDASRTRGSAKPGRASCDASASSWRGAGCAGNRTVRCASGLRVGLPRPAAAVGALALSRSRASCVIALWRFVEHGRGARRRAAEDRRSATRPTRGARAAR